MKIRIECREVQHADYTSWEDQKVFMDGKDISDRVVSGSLKFGCNDIPTVTLELLPEELDVEFEKLDK